MMSGIPGPLSTTLSPSTRLQSFLANKCQARMASLGSTLFNLTWKQRPMPSGRSIYALRASVRRISDNARSGWPTPTAKFKAGGEYKDPDKAMARALGPHANDLRDFAQLAGWTTPTTRDWKDTPGMTALRGGQWEGAERPVAAPSVSGGMGDADSEPAGRHAGTAHGAQTGDGAEHRDSDGFRDAGGALVTRPGPTNGHWGNVDWLACRDGKWRPVEPGTFPLAHGVTNRVGALRGYGNAIVAPLAQTFIEIAMEYLDDE